MKARRKTSFALEAQERDDALDKLKVSCAELVRLADSTARKIAKEEGRVTSTEVWKHLWELATHDDVLRSRLEEADPRWMGAVFRQGQWRRIGWEAKGSHKRPVSVWELQPELNVG